jgi:hypothetical protein
LAGIKGLPLILRSHEDFRGKTRQILKGLVAVGDDVIVINDKGCDGKPLDDLAETLLAFLQGGLSSCSFERFSFWLGFRVLRGKSLAHEESLKALSPK